MPDIPQEAIDALARTLYDYEDTDDDEITWEEYRRDAKDMLDILAPIFAAQVRREVAAEFRAKAARIRAIPDDGLNLGQMWHRRQLADDYEQKADEIDAARQIGSARG